MPALDACYQQIVRALQKDGWSVDDRPYSLDIETTTLYIDIQARRTQQDTEHIILIEIKCFPDSVSALPNLYQVIGQYLVYRNVLQRLNIAKSLHLVIPSHAYRGIFGALGLPLATEFAIKLIVVNLADEAVEQWLE